MKILKIVQKQCSAFFKTICYMLKPGSQIKFVRGQVKHMEIKMIQTSIS